MSEQQIDELKQRHLTELETARNHLTQTELALAGEVCDCVFTHSYIQFQFYCTILYIAWCVLSNKVDTSNYW